MSQLALYLLGPPRLELDGEPVKISRRKALALLAYLAVTGGRHQRDALATLLWPEYDQSGARADLRRTLSQLRRVLGQDWLIADRETAGLNPDAHLRLDVHKFRQLLATYDAHGHPATEVCSECVSLLEEAVGLYRDDFVLGFTLPDSLAFDEWQFFQTEGLRQALASALERLVRAHCAQEAHEAAIPHARRWLALDPLHEPAHRHLMALYARGGQQSAALRQYQICQQTLAEELGLSPSPETTALYERIRAGAEIGREREVTTRVPHNLLPQPTPFIGREAELADLDELIANPDVRLITIVGTGGMGKTRLALAVAERILDEKGQAQLFPGGVCFVDLAPLSVADHIVPALAEALNFRFNSGAGETRTPREQILDYLRAKRVLLVVDNFEHLLSPRPLTSPPQRGTEGGEALIADVLQTAPDVKILITSRERLFLQAEQVYPIQGLEFPDWETPEDVAGYTAARLFLQSARRARPDFELATRDDLIYLARISHLVGGMPLALELAASWVDVLSLAEIADEIARGLDFLETELRDVPERHRGIRAVFDQTWERLNEAERDTLTRFSVFRGGCTRDAAREVTGASLRVLAALSNKSLIQYRQADGRYQMHELLRQYAAEQLARCPKDQASAQDALSAFFCAALSRWEADLKSARQGTATAEIEGDFENVRTAWAYALSHASRQEDLKRLVLAADGLGEFYSATGRWQEGEVTFQRTAEELQALHGPTPTPAAAARLLVKSMAWQVLLSWVPFMGVYDEHLEHLLRRGLALLAQPALAVQDTRAEEALIRGLLGRILRWPASRDQVEEGREHLEVSLHLCRTLNDDVGAADALYELSFYAGGPPGQAREFLRESLALQRRTGDPRRMARTLVELGNVSRPLLAFDEAEEMFEQAYTTSQAAGQLHGMVDARSSTIALACFLGEFDQALSYAEEALALSSQAGDPRLVALSLVNAGLTHACHGRFSRAAALIQQGMATYERWDKGLMPARAFLAFAHVHAGRYEAGHSLARTMLDAEDYLGDWAQRLLGWVAIARDDYSAALLSTQRVTRSQRNLAWRAEHRAWSQAPLGLALHGLGRRAAAQRELRDALQTCVRIRAFLPLMHLMAVIPVVLADEEEPALKERAVELYALAETRPFVANTQLFKANAGKKITAAAVTLPPDVMVAAQVRGRALDWWETARKLLDDLSSLDGSA